MFILNQLLSTAKRHPQFPHFASKLSDLRFIAPLFPSLRVCKLTNRSLVVPFIYGMFSGLVDNFNEQLTTTNRVQLQHSPPQLLKLSTSTSLRHVPSFVFSNVVSSATRPFYTNISLFLPSIFSFLKYSSVFTFNKFRSNSLETFGISPFVLRYVANAGLSNALLGTSSLQFISPSGVYTSESATNSISALHSELGISSFNNSLVSNTTILGGVMTTKSAGKSFPAVIIQSNVSVPDKSGLKSFLAKYAIIPSPEKSGCLEIMDMEINKS
ncbi:hypothetical protein RCL1_006267 [Eukaryota sp. TZLM3-RCL]